MAGISPWQSPAPAAARATYLAHGWRYSRNLHSFRDADQYQPVSLPHAGDVYWEQRPGCFYLFQAGAIYYFRLHCHAASETVGGNQGEHAGWNSRAAPLHDAQGILGFYFGTRGQSGNLARADFGEADRENR